MWEEDLEWRKQSEASLMDDIGFLDLVIGFGRLLRSREI